MVSITQPLVSIAFFLVTIMEINTYLYKLKNEYIFSGSDLDKYDLTSRDHCKIDYSPLLKFSQDFSLVIFGYMLIFLCFFSCFRTDITLLKPHFPLIFTIRPNDPWTSI